MATETKGKVENLKGRMKQAVGSATGDKELEAEGAADRAKGAAQEFAGKVKQKLNDAGEAIKEESEDDEEERERAERTRDGNA